MKSDRRSAEKLTKKFGLKILLPVAALSFLCPLAVSAQTPTAPSPQVIVVAPPARPRRPQRQPANDENTPAEKFIQADAKVNISLCVSEGTVKINGWERDEIRAFVSGGSGVGFLVREKNAQTAKPNLVRILGYDQEKNADADECLAGENIEIDVPRGAYVDFKGQNADVSASSVGKVRINNDAGSIALNEIERGIFARTYDGDITVEKSAGAMTLNATNGSLIIFDTNDNDVGDILSAKTTSGAIMMQQVGQKQIEASSNSGAIRFDGAFETGGQYSFGTTSGAINLIVPADSSCRVEAVYGGRFQSEISLREIKNDASPSVQKVVGVIGAGDASLSLKTVSGSINIRKK